MEKIRGFSLLETLISLTIFSFIILGTLEFYTKARSHFLRLKQDHETSQSALSGLDKIRIDVSQSGKGLFTPSRLKITEGISCREGILKNESSEKKLFSVSNLESGQTRIFFQDTRELNKNSKICIFDSHKGEIKNISSVDSNSCVVSTPLSYSYQQKEVGILLLREVRFYLDKTKNILRRKVNSSPAQPLIEEISGFSCSYDETTNLVKVRIQPKNKKEKKYELAFFPKNTALASDFQK